MSRTVDQGELQTVVLIPAGVPHVAREVHREAGEAQVQGDAPFPRLGVLVKCRRGGGAAQGSGEGRLAAVYVPEHSHVKVQRLNARVTRVRHVVLACVGVTDTALCLKVMLDFELNSFVAT